MNKYDKFEIKIASASVGAFLILMGLAVWFSPDNSLFIQALNRSGFENWWGMAMLLTGGAALYGAVKPNRTVRHHALYVSMLLSFVTFFCFLLWGIVTFPAVIILWIGLQSILCVAVDVCGHARVKERNKNDTAANSA